MREHLLGQSGGEGDRAWVEFERTLDAPIDVVWAMLTTEDGLQRWLAPARVDLQFGGSVDVDFGEGGVAGGEIIDLVPGKVLEYHWRFTGEPDSIIRFELEVVEPDRTQLRLQHRLLPLDQATGYAAGWHAHLDRLQAEVEGSEPVEWEDRFGELLPRYANRTG